MTDIMRPVPFGELIRRIFEEYALEGKIFSFNKELSGTDGNGHAPMVLFGENCCCTRWPCSRSPYTAWPRIL